MVDELVTGAPRPIIQNGYIQVPDTPGLGIELNEEVVKQHLGTPGCFEPIPQNDTYIIDDYRSGTALMRAAGGVSLYRAGPVLDAAPHDPNRKCCCARPRNFVNYGKCR